MDIDDRLEVDTVRGGAGGLTTPIFRQHRYIGLTRMPMNGCITAGKKLAKVKLSELSPCPFGCHW